MPEIHLPAVGLWSVFMKWVQACLNINSRNQEIETGGLWVRFSTGLHNEFKASLVHIISSQAARNRHWDPVLKESKPTEDSLSLNNFPQEKLIRLRPVLPWTICFLEIALSTTLSASWCVFYVCEDSFGIRNPQCSSPEPVFLPWTHL